MTSKGWLILIGGLFVVAVLDLYFNGPELFGAVIEAFDGTWTEIEPLESD